MRLAKGTRAKIIHPFFNHDRIGDVFEVAECNSKSITLNRCYSDSRSYLQASYTLPTEEFGDFFEIIGMEKPKKFEKNDGNEVLVGDYTENELDYLWKLAGSYEDLKALLRLGIKWHGHEKKKRERAQREWTQWEIHPITGLPFSVSHQEGKSSKVKVKCGAFVGIASCNPEDDWDIDLGIKLAAARAAVKRTKALANEKMENLRSIMRQIYGKAEK